MATVLHIKASTRDAGSYSLRTAQAFLESYVESHPGDQVRTLDLAAAEIPEFGQVAVDGKYGLMHGQRHTSAEAKAWEAVVSVIEDFKGADKLVLSVPMWNFGIPDRLKHYLDVIVQPGYTFSFSPDEGYQGLVTGRPAALFLARGGAYAAGTDAAALDFQRPYLEWVLKFIGFTDIRTFVIEPTLHEGPDAVAKELEAVSTQARETARTF